MIKIYPSNDTPILVKLTVGISWMLVLSVCILLPVDVLFQIRNEESDELLQGYTTIYWLCFVFSWIIIPLEQEYLKAGDFTVINKLKTSVYKNFKLYGIIFLTGIIFFIIIAAEQKLNSQSILGILICIGNITGMLITILLLGYSLPEIPKLLWFIYGDNVRYNKLIEQEKDTMMIEWNNIKNKISKTFNLIQQMKEKINERHEYYDYLIQIESSCPIDLLEGKYNNDGNPLKIDTKYNLSGKKEYEYTLTDMIKLNEYVKYQQFIGPVIQKMYNYYDINYLKQALSAGSVEVNKTKLLIPRIFSIFLLCVMIMIIWCELTIYSNNTKLSPFYNLIMIQYNNFFMIELFAFSLLLYLCICCFYALSKLRIYSFMSSFYLIHVNNCSDPISLLYHCSWSLCVISPLGYTFLNIIRQNHSNYSAFLKVLGYMQPIVFFGNDFHDFFPPFALLLIIIFFSFNGFHKIKKYLFDLDEESNKFVPYKKSTIKRNSKDSIYDIIKQKYNLV
jgi:hypothetical protein